MKMISERGSWENGVCPVCKNSAEKLLTLFKVESGCDHSPEYDIKCPQCGDYRIATFCSDSLDKVLGEIGKRNRSDLSAFIRERQHERGPFPYLSSSFLIPDKQDQLGNLFRARPPLGFTKRADRLLKALAAETPGAGHLVKFTPDIQILKWYAKTWSLDEKEFFSLATFLSERKRVKLTRVGEYISGMTIEPGGWERLEELDKEGPELTQGFVAMWFDDKINNLYKDALKPAIEAAGYAPLRIDEQHGEERIDHRIEVQIKQSRFLVADLTKHRGGVYFEAGFARALGKPVFFTCHKNDFDERHFDIQQFFCLDWDWDSLGTLKEKLSGAIENLCGRGPFPPPAEK